MKEGTRKILGENDRALGWREDEMLLNDQSDKGFHPVTFEVTPLGLVITLENQAETVDTFTDGHYSCNQELHVPGLARLIEEFFSHGPYEPIFLYRAGLHGADASGPYVRWIGRRSPHRWKCASRLTWNDPWNDDPALLGPEWRHIGTVPFSSGSLGEISNCMSEAFYVKPEISEDHSRTVPPVEARPSTYPRSESTAPSSQPSGRTWQSTKSIVLASAAAVVTWLLLGR